MYTCSGLPVAKRASETDIQSNSTEERASSIRWLARFGSAPGAVARGIGLDSGSSNLTRLALAVLLLSAFPPVGRAQDQPDTVRLEVTGSWWPVHSSGTIRASGTIVDLRSDLGVAQNVATFFGKFDLLLGRRNRILVEGTPFGLSGFKSLSRSITYSGQTFLIADSVHSAADLDYFYAGYEFAALARPAGHLGFELGGAYLNAYGSIRSETAGVTASRSETVGLPLAGVAFRVFPVHGPLDVEINGETKGMALGSYGHYFQAMASVGVGRGFLLVEGGYRFVNADVHTTNGLDAVTPEFRGPVVSLVFRLK
jgi:hypothetical protein